MIRLPPIATIAGLLCILPSAGNAQTQMQQDRIDTLARYAVTSPFCSRLGMTVEQDAAGKFTAAFEREVADWEAGLAVAQELMTSALRRQGRMLQIDLATAASGARTEAELRRLRDSSSSTAMFALPPLQTRRRGHRRRPARIRSRDSGHERK